MSSQNQSNNFVLDHNMNRVYLPDDGLSEFQGFGQNKEPIQARRNERECPSKGVQCHPKITRRFSETNELIDQKKCTIL